MTEVLFYHLERQRLEDVLPVLLERTLARGWRAVVEVADAERRDALDRALWTYRDDSFLPHGTDIDAAAEHQPILLTTRPHNPNGASVRFFDGLEPTDVEEYARVVILFSAHDPTALAAARRAWPPLKSAGHDVTYWQQSAEGRWERKG